jgi:hypothetical protein
MDIVAEWDQQFFRNKGLVMRIDMPGEEKFGLDFMDLYYEGIGNRKPFNIRHGIIRTAHKGKAKDGKIKDLARIRGKMFQGTRIVLDPLFALNDKTLYEQRGWHHWDRQSAAAKKSFLAKIAQDKLLIDNEPWDFNRMTIIHRVDRWPPSVSSIIRIRFLSLDLWGSLVIIICCG